MELNGKVLKLGSLLEGQSSRGAWRKQELIIETTDNFPRKICLLCWNDRVDQIANLQPGQQIKVQISIESREYNNRWYTDVTARQIEILGAQPAVKHPTPPEPQQYPQEGFENEIQSDNGDDLPF